MTKTKRLKKEKEYKAKVKPGIKYKAICYTICHGTGYDEVESPLFNTKDELELWVKRYFRENKDLRRDGVKYETVFLP